MNYQQSAIEATMQKVTYASSAGAVFLGLTANEIAAIGGLIVAVLAMIINAGTNIYFKRQHLKIALAKAEKDGVNLEYE